MNRTVRHTTLLASALLIALVTGCGGSDDTSTATNPAQDTAPPTNRVSIPPAVRDNLGITFATVERRRIQDTLRVPGRFEYLPTATRAY